MMAVNSGVDAFSTEVSALVMRSSPQARRVNGMTLPKAAATKKGRHIVRPVASGLCRDHKTTSRTAAPRPTRAQATVGGLIPSTETLMKRNDQPQMKASRKRRRIGVRRSQANAERGHAYNARMSRSMLERRLTEVSDRLKQLRKKLVLTNAQVAHF